MAQTVGVGSWDEYLIKAIIATISGWVNGSCDTIAHGCVHAERVWGSSGLLLLLQAKFLLSPRLSLILSCVSLELHLGTSGMCSHFTFYHHLLLKVQNLPLGEAFRGKFPHETRDAATDAKASTHHRSYVVARRRPSSPPRRWGTKDYNLKPRSGARFGRETNAAANPGRIIWD